MFDNPKKQLKNLEEALLSLEPEADLSGDLPEDDPDALVPGRNPAVDFSRMAYADEELEDASVLLKQRRSRSEKKARTAAPGRKKETGKKKRPFGGQILLAFGEILLIIAILRWWLQWIS